MEAECHIVSENLINREEAKQNEEQVNVVKEYDCATKQGITFEYIIYTEVRIISDTNTNKYPTGFLIQDILHLSTNTIKDTLFHLRREITGFPNLNKRTVAVEITRRWDLRIHIHMIKN